MPSLLESVAEWTWDCSLGFSSGCFVPTLSSLGSRNLATAEARKRGPVASLSFFCSLLASFFASGAKGGCPLPLEPRLKENAHFTQTHVSPKYLTGQ